MGCSKTADHLHDHMRKFHGAAKLKCLMKDCSEDFYSRSGVRRHMVLVHGKDNERMKIVLENRAKREAEKIFQCDAVSCKARFKHQSSVRKHMRTEHGEIKDFDLKVVLCPVEGCGAEYLTMRSV